MDAPGTRTNGWIRRGVAHFEVASAFELLLAGALVVFLLLFAVVSILRGKFDSDEAGHLHIAWSWTRGLVQYRDVFDNHMPLYHLAAAPIVGLIGERATILYWMRLISFPVFLVTAGSTYWLGTILFNRRVGLWAALALGFFQPFYVNAWHVGANNLWLALWLLALIALLRSPLRTRSALVSGILLGLCFGVSMKTTTLLLSLLLSGVLLLFVTPKQVASRSAAVAAIAVFLFAAAIVPLTIFAGFALGGVWGDMRYGVFDYNFLAEEVYAKYVLYRHHPLLTVLTLAVALPLSGLIAARIFRAAPDGRTGLCRALVALIVCCHSLILLLFWPPISSTHAPIYPLLLTLVVGALFALPSWSTSRLWSLAPWPVLVIGAEALCSFAAQPWWVDKTCAHTELLRNVLRLTTPSDYVFDAKGETIFRRRCFRPTLERIALKAIKRGLLRDDSVQQMIATRTCVVVTHLEGRFPKTTRSFIQSSYVPIAKGVMVAGCIANAPSDTPLRHQFAVAIPAEYKILSGGETAVGLLDGTQYSGGRFLEAGQHTFESRQPYAQVAVIWAQAIDRGFGVAVSPPR